MASMEAASPSMPLSDRGADRPVRLALLSTPRAGNNWLRHMLAALYRLPSLPVHGTRGVDWANLPRECLLAMHWHPTPTLRERLAEHGFQSIVLARHPLDVLISILHFALHYSSGQATQRWLEGEEGNERCIFAAMPRSTAFMDYATGRRAAALLSVSHEWWQLPGCVTVRYENLLQDPEGALQRLAEALAAPGRAPLPEVIAGSSMAQLRQSTGSKYHFWQGQSGLWRRLLPRAEANVIANAHGAVFAELAYAVAPDPGLDGAQADANWIKLIWEELAEDLFALQQRGRSSKVYPHLPAQMVPLRDHAELVERFSAVQNQLLATQVTYRDMLDKLTLAQQTVGEMRARCTFAETQAEKLRQGQAVLQARLDQAEETCDDLQQQLLQAREWQSDPTLEDASQDSPLQIEEVTPRAGRLACTLRRLGQRYPPLASLARWVSGP